MKPSSGLYLLPARDRLPWVLGEKGLKIEPSVDRETLAARDTRNDIKIQAPSIHGTLLTVIIEIKWSDNRDTSTNLVHQLGEDYLIRNGLSHGIYLVGWSGKSASRKRTALGKAPRKKSLADWQNALDEQAKLYHKQRPNLRIVPFVLDLSWKDPDSA